MSEEKRRFERHRLRVPVELTVEASATPVRGETADLSLGGFYIEMLFTLETGTKVDIALQLGESTVLAIGEVVTCDRTVGNGIQFTRMLAEDYEDLDNFLRGIEEERKEHVKTENGSHTERASAELGEDFTEGAQLQNEKDKYEG